MRTFGTILALLLIFFGLVAAGLIAVRIWQDNGQVRLDINSPSLSTAGENVRAAASVNGEPLVVGVESGGMMLATPSAAVALAAPADVPVATLPAVIEPLPTVDPCPPIPGQGYVAGTVVTSVGMLRVYGQPDVTAPPLAELATGQNLWIVAAEDGTTAVKRCDTVWHRVVTPTGVAGWVMDAAVILVPATAVPLPTAAPTAAPTGAPGGGPCVGGCVPNPCGQPCPTPCFQPCPTPCYQPCVGQPCTTPCGVYSQ
jgi:hypothetical protein